MNKLWVIGIGPGHEDYILPIAKIKVKEAQVVYGSQRHLAAFNTSAVKEKFIIPLSDNLQLIKNQLKTNQVAVLVSGDTGFYSMLSMIKKEFKNDEIKSFPGISSLSYFFAKLNLTYETALLASAHGRVLDFQSIKDYKCIGFLTDKTHNPQWLQNQFKNINGKIHIGMNLSYENEEIVTCDLKDSLPEFKTNLCVVVIEIE